LGDYLIKFKTFSLASNLAILFFSICYAKYEVIYSRTHAKKGFPCLYTQFMPNQLTVLTKSLIQQGF